LARALSSSLQRGGKLIGIKEMGSIPNSSILNTPGTELEALRFAGSAPAAFSGGEELIPWMAESTFERGAGASSAIVALVSVACYRSMWLLIVSRTEIRAVGIDMWLKR
jgi:hypothetical protein